jgi:hypothetical protein
MTTMSSKAGAICRIQLSNRIPVASRSLESGAGVGRFGTGHNQKRGEKTVHEYSVTNISKPANDWGMSKKSYEDSRRMFRPGCVYLLPPLVGMVGVGQCQVMSVGEIPRYDSYCKASY